MTPKRETLGRASPVHKTSDTEQGEWEEFTAITQWPISYQGNMNVSV